MEPKKSKTHSIRQLEQHIKDLTEALQRERADAENIRRRAEEDKLKLAGYFKGEVVRQLLPFIDNFDRALKHAPKHKETEEWLKGLSSIEKQLIQTLESMGVKRISTVGHPFDPRLHEAIQSDEGRGTKEVVVEEYTPGYIMGDEVLRHAIVKVAYK